jgi:hypothetical protein
MELFQMLNKHGLYIPVTTLQPKRLQSSFLMLRSARGNSYENYN